MSWQTSSEYKTDSKTLKTEKTHLNHKCQPQKGTKAGECQCLHRVQRLEVTVVRTKFFMEIHTLVLKRLISLA